MHERRGFKDWQRSPLYQALLNADISTTTKGKMAKTNLRTRDYALAKKLAVEVVAYPESSDEEIFQNFGQSHPSGPRRAKAY